MKTGKRAEEQIAFALKQAEPGTRVEEICHASGVSEPMYKTGYKMTFAVFASI
ncbi:transposase [Caballeronia catudaia]|uniref:Transposase n=1 Tax=Caballeronia catudaia TaxID=1777136 RepID=A0A158DGT6_9BURK|nr:transposase [Caballeronia catudaia]